ncbi:SpaH/EbpB family LPXTG-anchored major pilin [Pseudoclavibacter sp. CFCC 11306]|uniref:SpaH/EbpB family LPXTG-anchored major pilin n=1 Tax=Pseudoclavibacter sp. CFCC 11306 TaxID=1564493 RepID=UPI00178857A5|nr:SpaH/EbpB family LPXTG-anchored major pilin [Pseudoclavibacter sp. CFCC 11306]
MIHRKRRRGFVASAVALLSAAALSLGGALGAQADTTAAQPVPDKGTVHITKLEQPDTIGDPATGLAQNISGKTINGVTFEAYLVPGVDLGTNAGQQTASTLDAAAAASKLATDAKPAQSQKTAGAGNATFTDLPRGLYLFKEVQTADTPMGVTPANDFLVAVPLTNPETKSGWLTDIYVYPKNSKVSVSKTVKDDTAHAAASGSDSDNVTWTVKGDIPKNTADLQTKYVLTDTLDARLTYVASSAKVTLSSTMTVDPKPALPDLTLGIDYTMAEPTAAEIANGGGSVTVTFTTTGLAKLVAAWQADPKAQVQLTLDTSVNKSALNAASTTAAEIPNNVSLVVNDAKPVTATASVKVGDIKIEKVSSANDATKLGGATFQVFASSDDASKQQNALSIDGKNEWTTAEGTGQVVISGLFFSDFVNGETAVNNPRQYWLVETKAPKDYQLIAQPIVVNVTAAGTDVETTVVKNAPNNGGFVLPLTGGTGTLLLTVFGIAILAAVLIVARRRRAHEDAAK